jgi:hypothetical protein
MAGGQSDRQGAFPAADDWLKRAAAVASTTKSPAEADRGSFERFLTESPAGGKAAAADEEARQRLFQAYEAWKKTQK